VLRGALLPERLPVRCCSTPSWSYPMICGPSSVSSGSMIAMSSTWPRPVESRARSAVMMPNAVVSAATPSASPNGGSVGGPSG
jgi:hypothetical protein